MRPPDASAYRERIQTMDDPDPVVARTFDDAGVVEHAAAAAAAIRAFTHLTRGGSMPAPLVYEVLGHLIEAAHGLPRALEQIATVLGESRLHYELTDAPGRDPDFSILEAGAHLGEAAHRAEKLAEALDAARAAIAEQGYRSEGQR
jgi:hypothetical protein